MMILRTVSAADRPFVRKWQIGVIAGYSAVFAGMLVLMMVNHVAGGSATTATQAELTSLKKTAKTPAAPILSRLP